MLPARLPGAVPAPSVLILFRMQVGIAAADFEAWCQDEPPPSLALPSLAHRGDIRTIKLFSLNDYLGLSTHPAVCRAAADAALACGNGACR